MLFISNFISSVFLFVGVFGFVVVGKQDTLVGQSRYFYNSSLFLTGSGKFLLSS